MRIKSNVYCDLASTLMVKPTRAWRRILRWTHRWFRLWIVWCQYWLISHWTLSKKKFNDILIKVQMLFKPGIWNVSHFAPQPLPLHPIPDEMYLLFKSSSAIRNELLGKISRANSRMKAFKVYKFAIESQCVVDDNHRLCWYQSGANMCQSIT